MSKWIISFEYICMSQLAFDGIQRSNWKLFDCLMECHFNKNYAYFRLHIKVTKHTTLPQWQCLLVARPKQTQLQWKTMLISIQSHLLIIVCWYRNAILHSQRKNENNNKKYIKRRKMYCISMWDEPKKRRTNKCQNNGNSQNQWFQKCLIHCLSMLFIFCENEENEMSKTIIYIICALLPRNKRDFLLDIFHTTKNTHTYTIKTRTWNERCTHSTSYFISHCNHFACTCKSTLFMFME